MFLKSTSEDRDSKKITVFRNIAPCSLVDRDLLF
jgi:hypothetical protein